MKHIKSIDAFVNEGVSADQVKKSMAKAEKKLGAGSSAEELANFLASEHDVKNKYEEILNVLTTIDDDAEAVKSIASVINENVLNEAARVGRSRWKDILDDLKDMGWNVIHNAAHKDYYTDDDRERELIITARYGSDEIEYKVNDENGDEVDSGSFDAEGLSAGELDGEVWNYIEESVNEGRSIEKIEKGRTQVIKDMAKIVADWKTAKSSGDKEAEAVLLQQLKHLTAQKKSLENELNAAIADKDRDVELMLSEAEDVKKGIHDHWKELYNEDFVSAYPKVAKILKNRQNVDRRELARIWEETYGENFKEKFPKIWEVLD